MIGTGHKAIVLSYATAAAAAQSHQGSVRHTHPQAEHLFLKRHRSLQCEGPQIPCSIRLIAQPMTRMAGAAHYDRAVRVGVTSLINLLWTAQTSLVAVAQKRRVQCDMSGH